MRKSEALELLGGSIAAAAKEVGASYQAVAKWPEELPDRISDRVQAALWRRQQREAGSGDFAPETTVEGA